MRNYYQITFDVANINNEEFRIWLGYSILVKLELNKNLIQYRNDVLTYPTESTLCFDFNILGNENKEILLNEAVINKAILDVLRDPIEKILPIFNKDKNSKEVSTYYYTIFKTDTVPVRHPNHDLNNNYKKLLEDARINNTIEKMINFEEYVLGLE